MTRSTAASTAAASEIHIRVPLRDLGLAPENLRFEEPADEDVPQLADTIAAAGVIIPPIVRPGRKGEQAFMALDGRRRRMALLLLLERGQIDETYEVDCRLAASKSAQAAAVVLPNAQHAPVHIASIIQAVGKFRQAKMDTAFIARSLGYAELEIKRLEALAGVHPTVLLALRQGRLTLKQVKRFTRLPDRTQQAQLAQAALDGCFQDYQLRNLLDDDQVTVEDPRFALVGATRYGEAGGRFAADLFGELPDKVLDPEILEAQWRTRLTPLVEAFKRQGLAVYVGPDSGYRAPDGFDTLPYVYAVDLSAAQKDARARTWAQVETAQSALREAALDGPGAIEGVAELLAARQAHAQAALNDLTVGAVLLTPDARFGVEATFYAAEVAAPDEEGEDDETLDGEDEDGETGTARAMIAGAATAQVVELAVPDVVVAVEGTSHSLHETRTDIATRGLIRDLADDPGVALTALVAQLFKLLALKTPFYPGQSALTVSAMVYKRGGLAPHPALDGEVRARLEARREAYLASGLRPIGYVDSLAHGDKMALLAELVAVSLDVREVRTGLVRHAARAEASEIAALCDADLSLHWTPDAAFLSVHSKAQLLDMLGQMGVEDARARGLKKDELVAFVAEAAAERRWTPATLAWTAAIEAADPAEPGTDGEVQTDEPV